MEQYFCKNELITLTTIVNKKEIAKFRKYGDLMGQCVTTLRFQDTIYGSNECMCATHPTKGYEIIYNSQHEDCHDCILFKELYNKNELCGINIYPRTSIPRKRYYWLCKFK